LGLVEIHRVVSQSFLKYMDMHDDCVGEAGLWFVFILFYFYTVCYDFSYLLSPAADIVFVLEILAYEIRIHNFY
jgi:hypothetical protein